MSRSHYRKLAFLTAAVLMLGTTDVTQALSLPKIKSHDLVNEGSRLHVSGPDPYITFEPYRSESSGRFLLFNLHIENLPDNLDAVPFELFFSALSPAPHAKTNDLVFDPRYRVRLSVARPEFQSGETWFAVPLPDDRPPSSQLRLDFERCADCSIEVLSHPKVVLSAPDDMTIAKITRIYNGVNKLDKEGLTLPLTNWELHDMEGDLRSLSVTGLDPFMISPVIDISTKDLAGIAVTLSRTQVANSDYLDFQLFYATEHHGFRADASALVRVKAQTSNQYRFFIPLNHLSEEQPADHIVERIRFDFLPEESANLWRVKAVKAINRAQMADYQPLTPPQILINKQQRAGKRQLLVNVMKKIINDTAFTLFYLLLLASTAVLFWRRFKI